MRIMVNGTFDIIHRGHIELLNYARSLGTFLLVAIDTDKRVKELKGVDRPVNSQEDRKFYLENLRSVDSVRLFGSQEELIEIIKGWQPDIYVKGDDWKKNSPGITEKFCNNVIYYPRVPNYSTTNIITRCSSMDRIEHS